MQRKQRKSKKHRSDNESWHRDFDLGDRKTKMRHRKGNRNRVREAIRVGDFAHLEEIEDE